MFKNGESIGNVWLYVWQTLWLDTENKIINTINNKRVAHILYMKHIFESCKKVKIFSFKYFWKIILKI